MDIQPTVDFASEVNFSVLDSYFHQELW